MQYSIKDILEEKVKVYNECNYIFEKNEGKYVAHTYKNFYDDVMKVASFLQSEHNKEDKIIIYAENSYNYMVTDAAIMGFTCVSAPLSKEWNSYDISNAIDLIKPKTFIYSNSKKDVVKELKKKYPEISYINIENIIPNEKGVLDLNRVSVSEPCKIIFSSGTIGMPKGVVLTQEKMFACYDNLCLRAPMDNTDIDYLFLPLSHTYAGIWNFLISMISGMKLYLCSDTKLMFQEIQEVKPTVFCAVPLIYERLYTTCLEQNIDPKNALGGNIKYLYCGGAFFKPEIRKFLKESGLNLLEAYGLTETSSLISVEYPNNDDFESVGTIFENTIVKIENPDDKGIGEICVKGNNVFEEYYANEYQTKKAIDNDGYFHTGDLGKLDGNKLFLKARMKRVIIFANGENIYPEDIENMFIDDNINKVKVFDKHGVLFASVFVNQIKDYKDMIDGINLKLPNFSKIKDFEVIVDDISKRMT